MSTDSSDHQATETFGERIERLRKERGFKSQGAFAKKTGIDRTRLNRLVNGHGTPTENEIACIAQALGLSIGVLLANIELPKTVSKAIDRTAELLRRALEAERARDEAVTQAKAADDKLARREAEHQEELDRMRAEQEESRQVYEAKLKEAEAKEQRARVATENVQRALTRATEEKVEIETQRDSLQTYASQLAAQVAQERASKEVLKLVAMGAGLAGMYVGAKSAE